MDEVEKLRGILRDSGLAAAIHYVDEVTPPSNPTWLADANAVEDCTLHAGWGKLSQGSLVSMLVTVLVDDEEVLVPALFATVAMVAEKLGDSETTQVLTLARYLFFDLATAEDKRLGRELHGRIRQSIPSVVDAHGTDAKLICRTAAMLAMNGMAARAPGALDMLRQSLNRAGIVAIRALESHFVRDVPDEDERERLAEGYVAAVLVRSVPVEVLVPAPKVRFARQPVGLA